ncbi:MAG: sodium:proton antiporter [Lachnospiraceae bacterium]|nr:sodium:proton antiporter [Lachnospiraceae bacterium]
MGAAARATDILLLIIMLAYALLVVLILIRAVKGPRIADRLMAINMIGTVVILLMSIIAYELGEDYLLDIGIIYATISFLAVVILTKVYMGVHEENVLKKQKLEREKRENAAKSEEDAVWDELLNGL